MASILFAGSLAGASVPQIRNDQTACLNKAMSTYEMNSCQDAAYKAADLELNKTYSSIRATVSGNDESNKEITKRLVASEKAWIAYRDANCSLSGIEMLGGTGETMIVVGCLADTTLTRITDLQKLFEAR